MSRLILIKVIKDATKCPIKGNSSINSLEEQKFKNLIPAEIFIKQWAEV